MFLIKNIIVFVIGLIQSIIGVFWFIAFLNDLAGKNIPSVNLSIHLLFGIILLMGIFNICTATINMMHLLLKTKTKFSPSLSVGLLTVILTVIIFLMLRFAFSLS